MQPVAVPPKTGKVEFQQGLIFGLIQAVVASSILLVDAFVFNTTDTIGASLGLTVLSFFVGLAAYFVAGIFAAKQTGKVKAGTFAGMWTGGIYGTIGFVVNLVLFFRINLPKLLATASGTSLYASNPSAYQTGMSLVG